MRSSLVSATIHVVIISLVVLFTPRVVTPHPRPEQSSILIYRPPPPVVDAHPIGWKTDARCECLTPTTIEPPAIPTIDTPSGLPSPDLSHGITEPWQESAHDFAVGAAAPTRSGVLSADIVDVQVTPFAGAPTPKYPEALRQAGVEGEVTLEFVVDTAGRVEHDSEHIISSTSEAFVLSVRDALNATRYHPALAGGRRVRQLVRQQFVFSLTQH
jgi:protein TonB